MSEVNITFDTAKLERLIYIVIILVLAILLWKKPYLDETVSPCADGIQNQGETNIDCGGPCGGAWDGATCVKVDGTIPAS